MGVQWEILLKSTSLSFADIGIGLVPQIPYVQEALENAWSAGFDVEGAAQLGHKIMGKNTWIGATEIVTLLRSFGIRARLVDFWRPTGADGTHPELSRWTKHYFTTSLNSAHSVSNSCLVCDDRLPLFLQHSGHSRTVVGIELDLTGDVVSFLIFDPASPRALRIPPKEFNERQYQLVFIDGLIQTTDERDELKVLRSIRIPEN